MINQVDIIDNIKLDETDNSKLVLAVSDHLEWKSIERQHLLLLQEKLNNYVNYILNKQYEDIYKDEICSFQIIVYVQYQPKKKFEKLLSLFNKSLKEQFPEVPIEISYQFVEN